MFGQYPAEPAVCSSGVRNVSSDRGFILILGRLFRRLHGPSYLLVAVTVIFEESGEELQLLCQGTLVIEGFCSVYLGGEN